MTQKQTHIFDDMISSIETETSLSEHERNTLLKKMSLLKQTKVNILITGALAVASRLPSMPCSKPAMPK